MASRSPTESDLPPVHFDLWLRAKGITRAQAAEAMETTTSKLSKLVSGDQKWSLEWLARAARAIGVSTTDLLRRPTDAAVVEDAGNEGFHDGWKPKNVGGIAQLDARAGAGNGSVGAVVVIETGGIVSGHVVTDEWVVPRRALGAAPSQVFAVPVDGTSMEPGLKSEDIVFVDRMATTVKSDEVHLIDDGSGPMVKRIRLEREHEPPRLWIMSDNPSVGDYWRPADTIRVIGRVIGKFVRM